MIPLITAHSGCEGTEPGSLESIYCALDCGADAVEIDVRMDRCGMLRLSHNAATDGSYEKCVTLQQAFDILRSTSMAVNLDVKEPAYIHPILDLAERCGLTPERLFISGAVSPEQLAKDPTLGRRAQILLNIEEILKYLYIPNLVESGWSDFPVLMTSPWEYARPCMERLTNYLPMIAGICHALPVAGLNSPLWFLDEEILKSISEHSLLLSIWTVDKEEDLKRFFLYRAPCLFNITTRQVKLARRYRREIPGE